MAVEKNSLQDLFTEILNFQDRFNAYKKEYRLFHIQYKSLFDEIDEILNKHGISSTIQYAKDIEENKFLIDIKQIENYLIQLDQSTTSTHTKGAKLHKLLVDWQEIILDFKNICLSNQLKPDPRRRRSMAFYNPSAPPNLCTIPPKLNEKKTEDQEEAQVDEAQVDNTAKSSI